MLVRAKTVGNEVMNRMKKQQEAEDAGDDDDWD